MEESQKPTYQEQLDWLKMIEQIHGEDPEMVKAISENVIVIRNYHYALDREIEYNWRKLKIMMMPEKVVYSPYVNEPTQPKGLNQREHSLIDSRINRLKAELQINLSVKKQFRNQQQIEHCRAAIDNLKKWKNESLLQN